MINIAFVIDGLADDCSGTEQQLISLIRNLDKSRFRIFLCCLRFTSFLKTFSCCEVHVFEVKSMRSHRALLSALDFIHFLRDNKVHIVQTFFREANFFGVICGRVAGVSVVLSTRRGVPYWNNYLERIFVCFVNRFTDRFIVNSSSVKNFLVEREGVKPRFVDVICNSIDTYRMARGLEISRQQSKKRLNIEIDEFVVGIVANLRPVKRHDLFIRAAGDLCKSYSDWRFVVVGDGFLLEDLQEMVLSLGIEKSFVFLGMRSDVPEIVRAFDVGVLCSDHESTSNTLLEYVALEVPAVCTSVGDNSYHVKDGVNGFIVPVGDSQALAQSVLHIREGKINSNNLKIKSEEILNQFAIDKIVSLYMDKYIEVTSYA